MKKTCASNTAYHQTCGGTCYFNEKDWTDKAISVPIKSQSDIPCSSGETVSVEDTDAAWNICMDVANFVSRGTLMTDKAAGCLFDTTVKPQLDKAGVDLKDKADLPGVQCSRFETESMVRLRVVPRK